MKNHDKQSIRDVALSLVSTGKRGACAVAFDPETKRLRFIKDGKGFPVAQFRFYLEQNGTCQKWTEKNFDQSLLFWQEEFGSMPDSFLLMDENYQYVVSTDDNNIKAELFVVASTNSSNPMPMLTRAHFEYVRASDRQWIDSVVIYSKDPRMLGLWDIEIQKFYNGGNGDGEMAQPTIRDANAPRQRMNQTREDMEVLRYEDEYFHTASGFSRDM